MVVILALLRVWNTISVKWIEVKYANFIPLSSHSCSGHTRHTHTQLYQNDYLSHVVTAQIERRAKCGEEMSKHKPMKLLLQKILQGAYFKVIWGRRSSWNCLILRQEVGALREEMRRSMEEKLVRRPHSWISLGISQQQYIALFCSNLVSPNDKVRTSYQYFEF